jgi:peptidoglycan lytic transglycosylase
MTANKKSTTGRKTRLNSTLAILAGTILIGGTATEASAKTRHHHHHHRHHVHHAKANASGGAWGSSSWRDANASFGSTGHGFAGVASMYGNESGSRTASGQRFNENAMTCAHRSLPFGTKLRVSHAGRSIVVTVNDRGPFVRGRVIDLSKGAARALGISGLGHVTAEVIG